MSHKITKDGWIIIGMVMVPLFGAIALVYFGVHFILFLIGR